MTTQAKNSISMRLLPNHRQGESRSRPCSAVTDIGRKQITRRAPLPTAVVNLPTKKRGCTPFTLCSHQTCGGIQNPHLHSMWSILCIDHIRHLVCIECVIFWYLIHTCYVWDQAVQQDFFIRWDWCILYWNILSNFSCDIEFKFTLPNIQICYW